MTWIINPTLEQCLASSFFRRQYDVRRRGFRVDGGWWIGGLISGLPPPLSGCPSQGLHWQ